MDKRYYYELTYLVKPDLTETELRDYAGQVESLCSQEEPILKSELSKRIRLAYPIKKYREAILLSVNFQAEPATIIAIKKVLDGHSQNIRFLIAKKRIVIEEPKKPLAETRIIEQPVIEENWEESPQLEPKKPAESKTKKEKLAKKTATMEDIEKDLEKILGE